MSIYLVQHGKAHSKDIDPDRNLNSEGITNTVSIAMTLKKRQIKVSKIFHSGKARSMETAAIIAKELGINDNTFQMNGIAPSDPVGTFAAELKPDSNVMYIGHLPFMDRLASYLTVGNENQSIIRFQNSGVVCLDKSPDQNQWLVEWILVPSFTDETNE